MATCLNTKPSPGTGNGSVAKKRELISSTYVVSIYDRNLLSGITALVRSHVGTIPATLLCPTHFANDLKYALTALPSIVFAGLHSSYVGAANASGASAARNNETRILI